MALPLQGSLIERRKIAKLDTAAEAPGIANDRMDSESLVRFGNRKFNLHALAGFKFGGDVDRHSLYGKIVTAALQNAPALLHNREQLDRNVNPETR